MESTSTHMNRLGKALVTGSEILSLERILAEVDAVEAHGVCELATLLLAPERLSAAAIGPSEERVLQALERGTPALAAGALRPACRWPQHDVRARARPPAS